MALELTYRTAGESHGPRLVAIVEGFPAGVQVDPEPINELLRLRQVGYGRGSRMDIESDRVEFFSGLRRGKTIGSPIGLSIANRDASIDERLPITRPRPGHADLAGAMKFGTRDIQDILERASARETAARVAVGGLAEQLLSLFEIDVLGYVVSVGKVVAPVPAAPLGELRELRAESAVLAVSPEHEGTMKSVIDEARSAGDTVGGVIEVRAANVPPGLGTHTQWCDRLDGRLARALMSIPAVKGVEIGLGFEASRRVGSEVHDEITYDGSRSKDDRVAGFRRESNNAGGIEGGITNGEDVVVRFAVKPIPSLAKPLRSVDLVSKQSVQAAKERADVCVVAPAAIVGEAAVAFELARALLSKFGGDSLNEVIRNFEGYLEQLRAL